MRYEFPAIQAKGLLKINDLVMRKGKPYEKLIERQEFRVSNGGRLNWIPKAASTCKEDMKKKLGLYLSTPCRLEFDK